jgi:hypothetical protein
MKKILLLIILIFSSNVILAQVLEDGLNLTRRENGISARSNALGMSFHGINDDGSSLYFNPAGLYLVPTGEIQAGVNVKYINSDIRFIDERFKNDRSSQYLNNFTYVVPFENNDKKFTFGIGYFRDFDFRDLINFSAFNPNNSLIGSYAARNDEAISGVGLAPEDSPFLSPVSDSLQQNYSLRNQGNNSRFTMGMAFSLGEKAAIGASYSLHSSNFSSFRKLDEFDIYNKYNFFDSENWTDVDLSSMYSDLEISQSIVGHTGSIGLVVTPTKKTRAFLSVDLPTRYNFTENWRESMDVYYDDGDFAKFSDEGETHYTVVTPTRFNFGISQNIMGFTISGALTYMDMTNLNFRQRETFHRVSLSQREIDNINSSIDERLASAKIDWGVGVEYKFPLYPIFLRGSYSSYNTPYRQGWVDLSTIKTLAVGAGFLVGKHIMLDVSLSNSDFDRTNFMYSSPGVEQSYIMFRNVTNVTAGFSYRF